MTTSRPTALRYFGKCRAQGCKTRLVVEINTNDYDRETLRHRCQEHPGTLMVAWSPLKGSFNAEKVCNGRCMASTGPSCDCSCGGENHGKNHL